MKTKRRLFQVWAWKGLWQEYPEFQGVFTNLRSLVQEVARLTGGKPGRYTLAYDEDCNVTRVIEPDGEDSGYWFRPIRANRLHG